MADEKKAPEKEAEAPKEEKKEEAAPVAEESKEDTKEVEVPKKFKSLVEEIEKMSVLDLSELVSILEDKFGVSASAPMMVAGGAAAGGDEGGEAEKDSFDVELTEMGANKISVIKAVREITGLGLKESKDIVDGAPKVVKENIPKAEAEEMKAKLEEAGATVTLK